MLVERNYIEEKLQNFLQEYKTDRGVVKQFKEDLLKHKIKKGIVQQVFNGTISLSELDINILGLFIVTAYKIIKDELLKPDQFFTEKEIKQIHQYTEYEEEKISLPITIDNVIMLNTDEYITAMSLQQITNLYSSGLLEYNFQTQREAQLKRRGDTIVAIPKLNQKSVKQITEHILNNTLVPSVIVFNVLADGNDDIIYDAKKRQLIINSGEIDILDGFHRISGAMRAVEINPEIDMLFYVSIKNYNIRKAQSYVAQINTVNKIDRVHLQALKGDRYADIIVKELQRDSDLKGRIVQVSKVTALNKGIVTYRTLADSIDEVYKIETKKQAMDVAAYLIKFFDYLVGSYPKEFIEQVDEIRKVSLINHNSTFAGYIVLSKRMLDNCIPITELPNILDKINFNKNNTVWKTYNVVDNKLSLLPKSRKGIMQYFSQIELTDKNKGGAINE